MALEGAKLICLDADDNGEFETIVPKGKSFKFGYYMDCDVVLQHPDALGLQCIINCDAFGRVTIENRSTGQPITLDGKTLGKTRPLLHNTEICILDKKYLWQFEGNPELRGFQMEDITDFTTPSKQVKKAQQPPNSEPARKWRRHFQNRLTIHSFAYCIKAGESPQDVKTTTDENKPLNIHERTTEDAETEQNKILSPAPATVSDFVDSNNTFKARNVSLGVRNSPLSYCNLTETVITSYSPRETGIRQEKSFAVVQSPQAAMEMRKTDISLGPFHHTVPSPQSLQIHRPSMHLIDLTTPMKLVPPSSSLSPARTLLKSTLKKNLPQAQGISPRTPQKPRKTTDISASGSSSETVYSVRSTDDESVIVVSDDGSNSPSPIARTPPRGRTPQSLMKRAIISSAKKAERAAFVSKKLLTLPVTPKNPNTVRFQSQSTPQRKSIARIPSSVESLSAGKPRKSLITSTPFRRGAADTTSTSSSRRSLSINSSSASLGTTTTKHESRNSLMLRQALSMTPTSTISNQQKRKSVSSLQISHKPRKSVSFLQNVDKEQQTNVKEPEVAPELNRTFSIEEDEQKEIQCDRVINDATPEKEKCQEEDSLARESMIQPTKASEALKVNETSLQKNDDDSVVLHKHINVESTNQTPLKKDSETKNPSTLVSHLEIEVIDNKTIDSQTPQSSKIIRTELSESITSNTSGKNSEIANEDSDYEFEGLDEVFKTPKAKNLMILSSPKSISLEKRPSDSVELIHSTEFDLSANLDDLFQTPQSELVNSRVDEVAEATSASCAALSPEEAFDMLVGRPSLKKSYARQKTQKKQEQLSPLKMSNDPTLPKTDIEEWIDSVNESIEQLDNCENEDEVSYLTSAMSEYSRDPLMMSSVVESSTKKINTPKDDEYEMTLQEVAEEDNNANATVRKDPLEMTVPRSLSPNISGIDLLDHTSDSIFSETLAVSDDSSLKETEKTAKAVELDNNQDEVTIPGNKNLVSEAQEDKARREIEEAFANFEMERKTLEEKRLVSTPEAKKPSISKLSLRRTLGNKVVSEVKLDLQAAKAERELELAFENFEEEPEFTDERLVKTPEPKKTSLKDHRRTLGSALVPEVKLDLQAAKAERELKLAFENFEEEPEFTDERLVKTPDPKKRSLKDHRRTLGSALVPEVKLDLQAAKAERELELAFENFEEEPEFTDERLVKTPEPKKTSLKDHRRTLGSALVPEVRLDLQAAKAERELEQAFENFEEEPEFTDERLVKTPEPKKTSLKDHRRTLGSALVPEVTLDLQAAKAERELEQAFENFEEEPEFSENRVVKTPEPRKTSLKDHRRTLGSALVPEVKLDLQAAKAERELELAFENFEEEPEFNDERLVKTPEPKKTSLKDHRRTLGSALVPEVRLDLQAAKAERELEQAFENFEEEPEFTDERLVKTPEPKKRSLKDHRRTLGSALVPEVKLDLQAAKAERELELAFENFEEEPEFTDERLVKTPEPKKTSLKDHRRTLGSALVPEVKLDLQAAKAERELELAFEHFEEEPEFSEERLVKTPEPKKTSLKDHRRTLGSALVPEVKLDLQAAKAERELEQAFENFEEEPEFSENRVVKTPEPRKTSLKDHRRTLGSALVPEVKLDLQAAKAERELELAFENFEEEPEFTDERLVKTPEPRKTSLKDHRRTLASALVPEVKLDLQAAKAERELKLAFENFEEEPEFTDERLVKTPDPKKRSLKDHRRTLGSALVPEVKLDLQAAKAERELELAFENFEEEPEFTDERLVKTPEPKKTSLKDHRRTLGSALVPEVRLDLQAAKAERELEQAFENFEEEPEFTDERLVKTPEPKKTSLKDHRRTLGSALVPEVTLDLQAAKAERELEQAFENFEEEPEFSENRVVKTPEPRKTSLKDHRRTLGSALVPEVKLDLQAAKAERELELAFENFEEEPEFTDERLVKTPEPKKTSLKDHRRTLGSALVPEVRLDLQAAKAERELEQAFENFEEEPEFTDERLVKTPEPKKRSLKDHRRTLGSALVPEVKLDLQAAKAERELELAFENFEEEPEFTDERLVKTPEPKKTSLKDHRRTLGSALVPEVKLDLQAAKAERELELAFEHFEEEPEFSEERLVKTPEPKKTSLKDHRRTLGSALVPEVKLDLQAAKAERELELAFENFEEEPEFLENRVVKTPEPKKTLLKDHRRTLGSALVPEVKLDLQAAKAERELELAFENFEEEPEFTDERLVKTPEPKKTSLKDHRRTLGSALEPEVKLDLQAAKAERELELAFENFEEEPEFSENRVVKTPEPRKTSLKDHRRTLGSALVSEVTLDLQAAKAERELSLLSTQITSTTDQEQKESELKRANTVAESKYPADNFELANSNQKDDEAEKSEGNKVLALGESGKNTVEERRDEPKTMATENLTRTRKTRQHSADNVEKPSRSSRKTRKTSNSDDEAIKITTSRLDSTDVESTEDETNQTSNNKNRKKRVLKKSSKTPEASTKVTELPCLLTPIVEEERNPDANLTNKEVEIISVTSSNEAEPVEMKVLSPVASKYLTPIRRTRQNSIDMATDDTKLNVPRMRRTTRQNSVDLTVDDDSKTQALSSRKGASNMEDQAINNTPLPLGSTDVDSDGNEMNQTSRNKPLKTSEASIKETEIQSESVVSLTSEANEVLTSRQVRKTRQKSIDTTTDDLNKRGLASRALIDDESVKTTTPLRRTRKNSVDTTTDDVQKPTYLPSRDLQTAAIIEDASMKKSNNEDEEIKITTSRLDSTENYSTEDEASKSSTNPRAKRFRKMASKVCESSLKETELHCVLEPIVEEEKNIKIEEELLTKSVITLKAEADEIVSLSPIASYSRIRGRRAKLNVVLLESKNTSSTATDKQAVTQVLLDSIDDCSIEENIEIDNGESIPATPVPLNTRGRRPSKALESSKLTVPISVQQEVDEVQHNQTEKTVSSSSKVTNSSVQVEGNEKGDQCSPDTSKTTEDPASSELKNIAPTVQDDHKDDVDNTTVVEAPPLDITKAGVQNYIPSKTRGRREAVKSETLSENIIPSRNRGRKRAADKVFEKPSLQEDETESHKEEVKDTELENISQLTSTNQEEEKVEQLSTTAPPQKRGRKAVVKTDLSTAAPLNATTVREPGLRKADSSSDKLDSPNSENKNEHNIPPEGPKACEQSEQLQPQHAQDDESTVPELKIISLLDSTNQEEENVENSSDVEEISTPVPSKSRGRRAAVKREAAAIEPLFATPVRRGGRKKALEMPISNADKLDSATDNKKEIQDVKPNLKTNSQLDSANQKENIKCTSDVEEISTPVPSKKRGRRAVAKIEPTAAPATLTATPVRRAGRRMIEEKLPSLDAQNKVDSSTDNENENKVPLTSEPRHLVIESSTPIGRTETESYVEETSISAPVLPKKRGRPGKKVQTVDHTDNSSLVEKQVHTDVIPPATGIDDSIIESVLVKSEPRSAGTTPLAEKTSQKSVAIKDEGTEQQVVSKKRNHKALVKQETESSNDTSTKDFDTSQEYSPLSKRNRRIPAKLTEFIVFNLVKSPNARTPSGQIATPKVEQLESSQEISTPIRKRGRPAKTHMNKVQSTPECLTPIPKRGRRAFVDQEHHDNSAPFLGKTKEEAGEILIRSQTRRNKAEISAPNSSLPVSEDQAVQVETKTQNKPTRRGRGKAATENNSTLESSQSTEESQPVAEKEPQSTGAPVPEEKTNEEKGRTQNKPTRGRGRGVSKNDDSESFQGTVEIQSTAEKTQPATDDESKKKPARRGRAVSEEQPTQVQGKAQTKPTRGRGRAVTITDVTLESSLTTEESKPAAEKESQNIDAVRDLSAASLSLPVPDEQTNPVKERTQNKPTRGRGRAVPKNDSKLESSQSTEEKKNEAKVVKPLIEQTQAESESNENESQAVLASSLSIPVSEEHTTQVKGRTQNKPIRGRGKAVASTLESSQRTEEAQPAAEKESQNIGAEIDVSTSNLSLPVVEEQPPQVKGRTQKKPTRGRGKAVASTLESSQRTEETQPEAEKVSQNIGAESDVSTSNLSLPVSEEQPPQLKGRNQNKPTRGRGKAIVSQPESSQRTEESQPAAVEESQKPSRSRGKAVPKNDSTLESSQSKEEEEHGAKEVQIVAEEAQPVANDETQKKTTRRGKAALTEKTSIPVSEEQPNQVEVKPQNKPTRGRGKAVASTLQSSQRTVEAAEKESQNIGADSDLEEQPPQVKGSTQNKPTRGRGKALTLIDSTQENTPQSKETTPAAAATKPKSTRGRKAVDTSPEKEVNQKPLETTLNEDEDKVDKKPKRAKKVVAADNHIEPAVAIEASPVTKKPTRGRKAKESDDQSEILPAQKLPRSGKVQDKDTKPASKRHILEIPTNNDDQQDTPSKRVRRKPIKLL